MAKESHMRKEKKQNVCNNDSNSQLSDYAAEVVFDFFLKVRVSFFNVQ